MDVPATDVTVDKLISIFQMASDDGVLDDVVEWLRALSYAFDEQSREINKVAGISKNEALIVRIASRSPSISVSGLAKRMSINPVSMVRILDHLEKQNLITRTRSTRDRRVVEIRITEKARDIDVMLEKNTQDILKNCLMGSDEAGLNNRLKPLQGISSLLNSTCHDASPIHIGETAKEKV